MFGQSNSDGRPVAAPSDADAPPKRDRRRYLTKVDKRTALGRRIAELVGMFTAALGDAELTPLRRLKVKEAAELKALAEKARGDILRDGVGNLDDIVRIERKANLALQSLRIVEVEPKPVPTLADYIASKGAHKAPEEAL